MRRCVPLTWRHTRILLTPPNSNSLIDKWNRLHQAPPGKQTEATLALLEETVETLGSHDKEESNESSGSVRSLLSDRETSQLIWKTLRRQRVPWRLCLALKDQQLACVSDAQRDFIGRSVKGRPWSLSHAVLASWDAPDPSLVPVYRTLRRCTTIVALSQTVNAALRSRPEYAQVLPVTAAVLHHCFALGLQGEGKDTAQLALRLREDHLTLVGEAALPLTEKEKLVLEEARLRARVGGWAAALGQVTRSPVVRLSEKEAFSSYVKRRELFLQGKALAPAEVPVAIASAPDWVEALRLLKEHECTPAATLALLSRDDVQGGSVHASAATYTSKSPNTASRGTALPWQTQLELFASLDANHQSYRVLRPILEQVPLSSSAYIVTCAQALTHVAARMYPGTLTRRVHSFAKAPRTVPLAVALCCAAGYYDVAALLVTKLPAPLASSEGSGTTPGISEAKTSSVAYQYPAELLLFSKTAASLRQPRTNWSAPGHGLTAAKLPEEPGRAELLAHALYGNRHAVTMFVFRQRRDAGASCELPFTDARLLALLSAHARATGASLPFASSGEGTVRCFTFASATVTQMVCQQAAEKDRRYFAKVIPRALLAHHFGDDTSAKPLFPTSAQVEKETSGGPADNTFLRFLHGSAEEAALVQTTNDCHKLLQALVQHLRSGFEHQRPTEDALLKGVARACATGQVRLPAAHAFGLSLATLKASYVLSQSDGWCVAGADALALSTAFQSTPSHFLDQCGPALAAGVSALLLAGSTRLVTATYTRWSRKEKEGTEPIPTTAKSGTYGGEHLADVFLRAAYAMPREKAQRWAVRLWRDYRQPSALLLQELLVGDTRQVIDLLGGVNPAGDKKAQQHRKILSTLERQHLTGMAFSVLDTTPALRFVVRAMGKEKVAAGDLDKHGFQRLLRALPGPMALTALAQRRGGERDGSGLEELWLLAVLAKADHSTAPQVAQSLHEMVRVSGACSGFLLLNAYATFVTSVASATKDKHADPILAMKCILRFTVLTVGPYRASACSLYSFLSLMMKRLCESPDVMTALQCYQSRPPKGSGRTAEDMHPLAHRVLHLLTQQRDLEERLRRERRQMGPLLRSSEVLSPLLLMGWLHHALSHHQHLPVAASFTSHMLRLAANETPSEYMSALRFFTWLRRPADEERLLLLRALADSPRDLTVRMRHTRGLLLGSPELVLVFADERPGEQTGVMQGDEREDGSSDDSLVAFLDRVSHAQEILEHNSLAGAASTGNEAKETEIDATPFCLLRRTEERVSQWREKDCERALGILRQLGYIQSKANGDPGRASGYVVNEDTSADAVRAVLAVIEQHQEKRLSNGSGSVHASSS